VVVPALGLAIGEREVGPAARAVPPAVEDAHGRQNRPTRIEGDAMNGEQPEPTEEEQEQAHSERQREEDEMRGAGHGDPDDAREKIGGLPDQEGDDA
jgi:hypothetical protein